MSEHPKLPDIVKSLRVEHAAWGAWRERREMVSLADAAAEIERLRSPAPAEATPSPTGTELALDEAKRHIAILTKFWMDSAGWHKASEDARAFISGIPTPAPAELDILKLATVLRVEAEKSGFWDWASVARVAIERLRSPPPAEDSEAYRLARLIVDHPNNQTESAGLVTGVIIARAFLASRRTTENGEGLREAPDIERIILRRLYEKRIEGYTLEMSQEIAALSSGRVV